MSVEAPVGDLTLVFTDIQGSTALWEEHPRAMPEALALHDTLMRETLRSTGGYEVKTEGDAFMVAFEDPTSALGWAMAVQEGLAQLSWPSGMDAPLVRMGIHCGAPECRRDPVTDRMDYFGPMVNRAARIAAAAHGGQVFLSAAAWRAATIDDELVVQDLGEHRLKGLSRPEQLFSVLPRSLATRRFPPPRTQTMRMDIVESGAVPGGHDGRRLEDALRGVAQSLAARGEVRRYLGRAAEGEADLRLALACARHLGDPAAETFVLVALGRLLHLTSRLAPARDCFAEAVAMAEAAGDLRSLAAIRSDLAAVDTGLGRLDDALAGYDEALSLCRQTGRRTQEAVVLSNLGRHHLMQGALEEAEERFREAVDRADPLAGNQVLVGAINNLGVVASSR